MADEETLKVYDLRAGEYARTLGRDPATNDGLARFMALLPPGGRVLDLGCGPGTWAAVMAAAGFVVDAVDASDGMVDLARKVPGVTAWRARFDEIEEDSYYDGIWANFSLLHSPRDDMPLHLARLKVALKPGGVLHIGLKAGEGERRDPLGRFYSYYGLDEMRGLLRAAGFEPGPARQGADKGLDGVVAEWFTLTAHA